MPAVQRVMIIGGPGSGKSWLARAISSRLGLPVIAIDDLLHDQGGHLHAAEDIDRAAIEAAQGEWWVIEGGNSRTYAQRAARADLVIRMTTPKWLRLVRVLRRGGASLELLRWVLLYDGVFGARDRATLRDATARGVGIELGSARRVGNFLNTLS